MDAKVLVYQAYGNENIIRQAMFSLVSLLKWLPTEETLQVWIYTDKKQMFEDFFGRQPRFHFVELTSEQIQKWRGKDNFIHRVKIEALKDAASKFKGCLYYCDSDTYFLDSPKKVFSKVNASTSLMHVPENSLDQAQDPISKKIFKFVKKHHFQVRNELVGIGPSTVMWNAGVLGISEENKALLDLILELADQAYHLYQKHVMEQLAFSFYLQTRTEIISSENVICHYWREKLDYQASINQFLAEAGKVESALEKFDSFEFPELQAKGSKKSLIRKILRA